MLRLIYLSNGDLNPYLITYVSDELDELNASTNWPRIYILHFCEATFP